MNPEIETEFETEQVIAARENLESLQKRRAEIVSETEGAEISLAAAQQAAIDGTGSTAQLSQARELLATLRELLGALEMQIETAQGEFERVSFDAREDALLETLHTACAQHLFIHHEAVVPVCQSVNAQFLEADAQISDAESEREIPREEARAAFEKLCPGILNRLEHAPPPDELAARAKALVQAMRSNGIDTSALQSNDEFGRYYWFDSNLDELPESGLNPVLEAARRPQQRIRPDHSDAHTAAVAVGGPVTPAPAAARAQTRTAQPTGPIFGSNGKRDYVAENLRKSGRN